VPGSLKAEIGGPGETLRRLAFYGKEHAVIKRKHVAPSMLLDELVTDILEPCTGTGIVNANSVCAN